ncbi:MAG: VOC family protein [Chitinophagaceae bacterium]|nr:VOC family protein [Chitinophagaceae bacterium]
MKITAGTITSKLKESKEFYLRVLGFSVVFENDFFVLLSSPGNEQISFLLPNHSSQQPIFQQPFQNKGTYLTVEVDDVDAEYKRIKNLGVAIEVEMREEPWGDRHFAFYDPNGIGIDVVKYTGPEGA